MFQFSDKIDDKDAKDENGERMPPIGNGVYIVTIKLKKDLPNWLPMYGRKVCLEYEWQNFGYRA